MTGPIVPDASVLLKWVMRSPDEENQPHALALKDAWLAGIVDIVIPTLWAFEVGNVLGLKQSARAEPLLQAMFDLTLPEERPAAYAPAILELMRAHAVTFYDAAYHALAIVRRGTMLTADRRYLTKARAAGHVALLTEWQVPSKRP